MINSFWRQLANFGVSRIILSIDFIFSVLVVITVERSTIGMDSYGLDYGQILDVLVGLFAFVFAALAILVAMSGTKFTKELSKAGTYEGLLFHYWFTCNVILVSIGFTLFISIAKFHSKYIELGSIFLVTYSLCIVLGLVKTTISAGIYQNRLDKQNEEEHNSSS